MKIPRLLQPLINCAKIIPCRAKARMRERERERVRAR